MNTAEQVLVIILSSFLAVFLILAIIATVMFIQLMNEAKVVVTKAKALTGRAEVVVDFFKATIAPAAFGKLVATMFQSIRTKRSRKGG